MDNSPSPFVYSGPSPIIVFFWTLVSIYAIYLSFKCNKGFDIWGFLGAFFFGPLYIAYKLGADYDGCFPKKSNV
jgi:hypothetical protein